jgi:acyl-CoA synthetase (AMP-forming)/AMP-acid ligase II
MGLYDNNFYTVAARNALCYGGREAWFDEQNGFAVGFDRFFDLAGSLAGGLRNSGVNKGDRIAVLGKNRFEFFLVFGAAAALGAVVVPINWRLSPDEIAFNITDAGCSVLFLDGEFSEMVKDLKARLETSCLYLGLDGEIDGYKSVQSIMTGDGMSFDAADVAIDDDFVIIHTAAVAGRPRGAVLSHGNVLHANMHFSYFFGLGPDDVHLSVLPLFHVGGLFMATAAFHAGALNVNMAKFDGARAAELIEKMKISFMMDFTPMLSGILDEHDKSGKDLSSLRAVTGLESPETIERYQNVTGGTFWTMYGQTETSCLATFGKYDHRPGSAGRPLPLADVRLFDDYDRPVPQGQVGEICMRGPMVFKGYWNLPEDNARTFREGWHHTGDTGRFDEDGFLWYAGRKAEKELIKPGGENVYPAEVEKTILLHPAVEEVVVFGVPDAKWKEGIKAVCRLKKGHSLAEGELVEFVGGRIARYKKPQYVEFIEKFPVLEDGTIDRVETKRRYGGS